MGNSNHFSSLSRIGDLGLKKKKRQHFHLVNGNPKWTKTAIRRKHFCGKKNQQAQPIDYEKEQEGQETFWSLLLGVSQRTNEWDYSDQILRSKMSEIILPNRTLEEGETGRRNRSVYFIRRSAGLGKMP